MKRRNKLSSFSRLRRVRQPLLSSAAMGSLLISVPVAAMLLVQPETAPPPAEVPAEPAAKLSGPATPEPEAPPPRPAAEVIGDWERLLDRNSNPTLPEFTAFLKYHSNFPNTVEVRQRAERLMTFDTPDSQRVALYDVSPPKLGVGKMYVADALASVGRQEEAKALAVDAWRSGALSGDDRTKFSERFGSWMSPADHAERVDRLLWDKEVAAAEEMLPLLDPEDRLLTQARIALQRGTQRGGDTAAALNQFEAVPANLRRHPGLVADQYAFARATKNSGWARDLLAGTTIAPGSTGHADAWMEMHLQAARAAANDRQFDLAYRIAAHHGGLSFAQPLIENSAAERDTFTSLEWFAGWTALHDLNRPQDAIQHFLNFKDAAQFTPTIARGWYWAGRAAEAAGSPLSRQYYAEAALFPLTFNGQLAREKLGQSLEIKAGDRPAPSAAKVAAFNADPRVQAVGKYGASGDEGKQRMFLQALADDADRDTLSLVADLANRNGFERVAVLSTRGNDTLGPPSILDISYPMRDVPAETRQQWVFAHGIMRQESQFETDAVSGAGARGLMQLMPATAREQARRLSVGYDYGSLTGSPSYNIRLGSDYFMDMVNYWDGSIVLAVASYNAGPGNVRRWVETNGDPRSQGVDVTKWIEDIPFDETRTYVRNVLSNFVVYDELAPDYRSGGPSDMRLSWYLSRGDRASG